MKSNKGQALLTVIVLTTIALSITVAISWRILSGLSRSSDSDTSTRVQAAAEGGAENFLLKSNADLDALLATCTGNYSGAVPDECLVTFEGNPGEVNTAGVDNISSTAEISVSPYGEDETEITYSTNANELVEVNLSGYTGNSLSVCWNGETVLQMVTYNASVQNKQVRRCISADCGTNYSTVSPASGPAHGYDQCVQVNFSGIAYEGIRIRSIGGDSDIGVIARANYTFPMQGYEIVSLAILTDADTGEPIEKEVTVRKSLPYLPAMFDFNIYADTGLID